MLYDWNETQKINCCLCLDQKLTSAETKMAEFCATFEKFQTETSQIQSNAGKKIEDVEIQIKSFKSSSEGTVQDVLEDSENLKVRIY